MVYNSIYAVPTIFEEIIRVDIQVRIWDLYRMKSMFFRLLGNGGLKKSRLIH